MRLKGVAAKHPSVECACGAHEYRDEGYTRAEASEWYWRHRRDECPNVSGYALAAREGLF